MNKMINIGNYLEMKKFFNDGNNSQKLKNKVNILLENLKKRIEDYIQKDNWKIDDKTQTNVNSDKDRGRIFIVDNNNNKIGIEHFDPNFKDQHRDDYIFCGKFDGNNWSGKKYISSFKGVEMRANSMGYVSLLLKEETDDLVSHFFEEFKTYFNNNK